MDDKTRSVSGDLKSFSIFDVTQSLMMGRKTALVTVQSSTRKGYVYFKDGQIVSALDDALNKGEGAVMDIFSWVDGSFCIDFEVQTTDVNIDLPTDHLLLEVARNLDEIRRDHGIEEDTTEESDHREVTGAVKNRFGEKLQKQLNSVFKRVAVQAEPGRDRYTPNAFDALLQALLELSGSVLFLRPGQRPRIKTPEGFATIKEETISADEIQGFLSALLSDAEATDLREIKEVATYFHSPLLGSFKVSVMDEHGSNLVTFTPAGRTVRKLVDLCPDPVTMNQLQQTAEGLVIIAGPLGSCRAELVGAVIEDRMARHDAFAFEFSNGSRHSFETERGFCVRRAMPTSGGLLHSAVRGALEQCPDVLAFVGGPEHDAFSLSLSTSGLQRLVLLTVESHSPGDTLNRVFRLARTADGDPLTEPLAERLRWIVDLTPPTGPRQPPQMSVLAFDREAQALLHAGDLAGLRRHRVASTPVVM